MIVKIRGITNGPDWWVFNAPGAIHYREEMLSVNDIDHGVQTFDDDGKETGFYGLGIHRHIVSEDVPEWSNVRYGNERNPEHDKKYPFMLMEIMHNQGVRGEQDIEVILFNTVAYICNDEGKTVQKLYPSRSPK